MSLDFLRTTRFNPQWNDTQFMLAPSGGPVGLRWWQPEAFDILKNKKFALLVAFCGSGKSLMQVALAVHDVVASGWMQKQLIVVPQSHMEKGFSGDEERNYIPILLDGKLYEWKVDDNFCDPDSERVLKGLREWLLADGEAQGRPYRAEGKIICGLNAIASHQALALVWNRMTDQERERAIRNLTLRVDEAHHVKGIFLQDEEDLTDEEKASYEAYSTNLGKICSFIVNRGKTAKLHFTTATPYRGDRGAIFSKAAQGKFATYYLDWNDHWKTLGIRDFLVEYEEYDGNPVEQVAARLLAEPCQKHLIIVPSTGQKWRHGDSEFKRLMDRIYEIFPKERVLELVTPRTQEMNKLLLRQEPSNSSRPSMFDVVVTCQIGREGTDWCPCSRLHNTVCENSMTLSVQTVGRPFRRFEGKVDIKVSYYVRRFPVPRCGMTKRELLSDRTNAILACMQLDDLCSPILLAPIIPSSTPQEVPPAQGLKKPSLPQAFGDQYHKMLASLFSKIESLGQWTEDYIDSIIKDEISKYSRPSYAERFDLASALKIRVLRAISPQLRNMGVDVAFLRENGFDKIIQAHGLKSLYFGGYGTKDWETIRAIMRGNWKTMLEKYKLYRLAKDGKRKKLMAATTRREAFGA
jgi:hypothetical protein